MTSKLFFSDKYTFFLNKTSGADLYCGLPEHCISLHNTVQQQRMHFNRPLDIYKRPADFILSLMNASVPVSRAEVTGRAEFTSEQLRMHEINTVNIWC